MELETIAISKAKWLRRYFNEDDDNVDFDHFITLCNRRRERMWIGGYSVGKEVEFSMTGIGHIRLPTIGGVDSVFSRWVWSWRRSGLIRDDVGESRIAHIGFASPHDVRLAARKSLKLAARLTTP